MERINFNTQIITKDKGFGLSNFLRKTTEKVANRVSINLGGLNTLDTTIVAPEMVEGILNDESLAQILDFSNSINGSIGIPETDSVIIRSSARHPKNKNSEPAVLAQNINSKGKKYEYLTDGERTQLYNVADFKNCLSPGTWLLIHSDNCLLQTNGVHARMHESNFGNELLAGTKVLQSRELEMVGEKKPSLKANQSSSRVISHYKLTNLLNLDTKTLQKMILDGVDEAIINGVTVKLKNLSSDQVEDLVGILSNESDDLLWAHESGQKLKGSLATTEIRIYPTLEKGIGSRIQVLDVD